MGTHENRLVEAVLTSNHNLRFVAKIRNNTYTPAYTSFAIVKVGFNGVYIKWTCFRDVL